MSYLTADGPLLEQLNGVKESVEIRDPSGKVLGHYTPILAPDDEELYARAAKLFDLGEMERVAVTEQHGYTIEEVMAHLRSLEKPE